MDGFLKSVKETRPSSRRLYHESDEQNSLLRDRDTSNADAEIVNTSDEGLHNAVELLSPELIVQTTSAYQT
jgi:hypothetical protein